MLSAVINIFMHAIFIASFQHIIEQVKVGTRKIHKRTASYDEVYLFLSEQVSIVLYYHSIIILL